MSAASDEEPSDVPWVLIGVFVGVVAVPAVLLILACYCCGCTCRAGEGVRSAALRRWRARRDAGGKGGDATSSGSSRPKDAPSKKKHIQLDEEADVWGKPAPSEAPSAASASREKVPSSTPSTPAPLLRTAGTGAGANTPQTPGSPYSRSRPSTPVQQPTPEPIRKLRSDLLGGSASMLPAPPARSESGIASPGGTPGKKIVFPMPAGLRARQSGGMSMSTGNLAGVGPLHGRSSASASLAAAAPPPKQTGLQKNAAIFVVEDGDEDQDLEGEIAHWKEEYRKECRSKTESTTTTPSRRQEQV